MGLDEFSAEPKEDDDQQEQEEDEHKEETTTEETDDEQEDKASGIEAFTTDKGPSKPPEIKKDDKEEDIPQGLLDHISSSEWNSMDVVERVKFAREHYKPDYRPDVHVDDRWEWEHVVEVQCVCKNLFTFDTMGMCLGCGRVYKAHGGLSRRVIELVYEPQDVEENNGN